MGKLLAVVLALILALGIAIGVDMGVVQHGEYMISGLDAYAIITPAEAESWPEPSGSVELNMNGHGLPYDVASNTYFIPQDPEVAYFEGQIHITEQPGYEYVVCAYEDITKAEAIEKSIGYRIMGRNGDKCISSKLIFTGVPAVCLTTAEGELPGEVYSAGDIAVFTAGDGALRLSSSSMEIKVRGNTSTWFPKKSYRIKLTAESGGNSHMSIAGLRTDDDWILNAMYTDASKIREKLAYSLWEDMNSAGVRAASSRMEYVEVFINSNYWGLYGIQERVDHKQVDGDKRSDILYKVATNTRPTVDELEKCTDLTACAAFEVQGDAYGGTVRQRWQPAAAYISALEGEPLGGEERIDLENTIDLGLWVLTTQAYDCHFKNQFLNCVYGDGRYTIYRLPWDVNHTFGDVWINDAPEVNYSDFRIGALAQDDLFKLMTAAGDEEIIAAIRVRWDELRDSVITDENLIARAREIRQSAEPAILRDHRRWPECGMGKGNHSDISDVEQYITEMLPRIDEYIETLGTN